MPGTTGFHHFSDKDAYTISSGIEKVRKRAGLTQRALAKILGVDPRAVCYWESGKHAPPVLRILQIKKTTGCAWEELLGV